MDKEKLLDLIKQVNDMSRDFYVEIISQCGKEAKENGFTGNLNKLDDIGRYGYECVKFSNRAYEQLKELCDRLSE